ncbi:MAG: hypothetical protein ACYDG4_04645 [Desulfuromonadaceae bacterium]
MKTETGNSEKIVTDLKMVVEAQQEEIKELRGALSTLYCIVATQLQPRPDHSPEITAKKLVVLAKRRDRFAIKNLKRMEDLIRIMTRNTYSLDQGTDQILCR